MRKIAEIILFYILLALMLVCFVVFCPVIVVGIILYVLIAATAEAIEQTKDKNKENKTEE
ncbi:MAG: hypothetical protein IJX12_07855 [Lachnospiraceae bacterium]|nr:hypothetical protein [Lachnospiraceae bacterium]